MRKVGAGDAWTTSVATLPSTASDQPVLPWVVMATRGAGNADT